MSLPPPQRIEESGPIDAVEFAALRQGSRPRVLRGQVSDWPIVQAAQQGDAAVVDYLLACGPTRPVVALVGEAEQDGRFFYNADLTGFNFRHAQGSFENFLRHLLQVADDPQAPATAVQSEMIDELLPAFAAQNWLDLLPQVRARIWLGNRLRVAPHYDLQENVGCCVSGRRRFTLFPPEQLVNLYPGPLELTPAGTPISMVDPLAPDLDRYPRFARAWEEALQATLEPGDALYIPFCWWHGVESLDPVSILVNYWWAEGRPEGIGRGYSALLHALFAYRHLPRDQREVWRGMLDFYVFEDQGDPAAHLPEAARGVLGRPSPDLFARMRQIIRRALD